MWTLNLIKAVYIFIVICLVVLTGWKYCNMYTVKAKHEAYMNKNNGDISNHLEEKETHAIDEDHYGMVIDEHSIHVDKLVADKVKQGVDTDQHGRDNLGKEHVKEVDQHGNDINQHGKVIGQHGKVIDKHGKDIDQHGKDVNQRGKDIDKHDKGIDQRGKDIDQHGKDIGKHGKVIDNRGNEDFGTDRNKHDTTIDKYGMALNWTLLLTVNDGFFDFFLNWFWYYKKLDLHLPIIIVAEDDKVYPKLKSTCNYCTVLMGDLNISGAVNYGTSKYKHMVSTRPQHILHVLRSGKNVIYADIDSVWLQNPLPFLNESVDIAAQMDGPGYICTGFMAIRSNAKTIDVIQEWHGMIADAPATNQSPFNTILKKNKNRIIFVGLDPLYFPPGNYFFTKYNTNKRSQAVIVHNNWIVGHDAKKNRFQKFKLWQI